MPSPPASRATTVAVTTSPTVTLESGALTLTEATEGGDTVRTKVAGPTPSTVTPIVAVPGATAVTRPVAETVATPVALLDQDDRSPGEGEDVVRGVARHDGRLHGRPRRDARIGGGDAHRCN